MNPPDESTTGRDIRRLLKTFGVQADEAIRRRLAALPAGQALRLRVTLEELDAPGDDALRMAVEGEVRREES